MGCFLFSKGNQQKVKEVFLSLDRQVVEELFAMSKKHII